jgi:hypothetical protein
MNKVRSWRLAILFVAIASVSSCRPPGPPTPIPISMGAPASPTSTANALATATPPPFPTQNQEFASLADLRMAAKFPLWLPTYVPNDLPFHDSWIADYADEDENVSVIYSEPGDPLDANLKSLNLQMAMTDDVVSRASVTHQFKAIALDVRQVQVRGQTGFTYWMRSGAAGNSAHLVWREGAINFSLSLSGNWPQPDENHPHDLDEILLQVAGSLQTAP